jgi:hypothetical protein
MRVLEAQVENDVAGYIQRHEGVTPETIMSVFKLHNCFFNYVKLLVEEQSSRPVRQMDYIDKMLKDLP